MTWLAQRTIYRDSTDLLLTRQFGGEYQVAERVTFSFKTVPQHVAISAPTLELYGHEGQQLLQALWDAGLRPNDGAGSGAQAAALLKHIAFAERIADGLLERLKP